MRFFSKKQEEPISFWDHLESLRWSLIKIIIVLIVLLIFVFGNKDFLFSNIILPPLRSDFVFYRFLCALGDFLNVPWFCPGNFSIQLININLSGQFIAHLSTSFSVALVIAAPYLLYEIWKFISPALYPNERKNVGLIFLSSSVLFYLGTLVSYFVIFPLTIRFLGTYQVSELIPNQISIQSYLSTLYILTFSLGIMFELPVLVFLLSKAGIIYRETLKTIRSYVLVAILIIAAIITPTTDPFTMTLVALPIYLLYEISILVACKKTNKPKV